MHTFNATRSEGIDYSPMRCGQVRGHGLRAPGSVVMVLRAGSGWVKAEDGTAEPVCAPSVTAWQAGDWVEYGSDGSGEFQADLYWAVPPLSQQRAAAMAAAFGPVC